jgi:hypothetical protein
MLNTNILSRLTGYVAILGALGLTLGVAPARVAAQIVDPVPVDNVFAEFGIGGTFSLDPNTGNFSSSDPIVAVQFPGQILSYDDPLILANAIVTEIGNFSGNDYEPL